MTLKIALLVFACSNFGLSQLDVDFSCPSGKIQITENPTSGSYPKNAQALVKFPANFDCKYKFNIPANYAVKLLLKTNYDSSNTDDAMFLTNSISSTVQIKTVDAIYYAPSQYVEVQLVSKTGQAQFYFSYEYIDISSYQKIENPTGTYVPLKTFPNKFYTFTSAASDLVTLHTAQLSNVNGVDLSLLNIYVFDGPDITSSRFLGSLYDFVNSLKIQTSTSSSISIVNFYGSNSDAWLISNDFSPINLYNKYRFILFNFSMSLTGTVSSFTDFYYACTFLCTDCSSEEVFISDLEFDTATQQGNDATVGMYPMTPTYFRNQDPLLTWKLNTVSSSLFPQLVPSSIFSMVVQKSKILIKLDPRIKDNWLSPRKGRSGLVFSPSLWNPQSSPAFDYSFDDPSDLLKFGVELQKLVIGTNGEVLKISVNLNNATTTMDDQYVASQNNVPRKIAIGEKLSLKFTGKDSKSGAIIAFDIADASDPDQPPTTRPTIAPSPSQSTVVVKTSTPAVVTTTRSACAKGIFSVLMISISITFFQMQ